MRYTVAVWNLMSPSNSSFTDFIDLDVINPLYRLYLYFSDRSPFGKSRIKCGGHSRARQTTYREPALAQRSLCTVSETALVRRNLFTATEIAIARCSLYSITIRKSKVAGILEPRRLRTESQL